LTLQVTVVSGSPLQNGKVTVATNVPAPPAGETVKVEVVDSPASTGAGVVGVEKVKVGGLMV